MPEVAAIVLSGPKRSMDSLRATLQIEMFVVHEAWDHGLPSYTDPITAHAAGAPNSGHAPGTEHPEMLDYLVLPGEHKESSEHECTKKHCDHVGQTELRPNPLTKHVGQDYEDDPDIAFLLVEGDRLDKVQQIADSKNWAVRAVAHRIEADPEMTTDGR